MLAFLVIFGQSCILDAAHYSFDGPQGVVLCQHFEVKVVDLLLYFLVEVHQLQQSQTNIIITQNKQNKVMSKYKSPIQFNPNMAKYTLDRMILYKLPFKKDEPIIDRQYKIEQNNLHIEKYKISSQNKSKRKRDTIHLQQQRDHNISKKGSNPQTEEKISQPKQYNFSLQLKGDYRDKKSFPKYSDTPQRKELQRSFLSSHDHYAEDSMQSNGEEDRKVHYFKIKKNSLIDLPSINEKIKEGRDLDESSLQSERVWDELADQIDEFKKLKLPLVVDESERKVTHKKKISDINNQIIQFQKRKNLDVEEKGKPNKLASPEQDSFRYKSINSMIPNKRSKTKKSKRDLAYHLPIYKQISQINPFFRKSGELGGCILLRMGRIMFVEPGQYLCYEGDESQNLYVVLYGKLVMTNQFKSYRKYIITGQTIAEEDLFLEEKLYQNRLIQPLKSHHQYDIKASVKSCLLRISKKKYYQLSRQMYRFGHRILFNMIDNLFKINYLNKIGKLNQFNNHRTSKSRTKTESSAYSSIRKNKKKSRVFAN